MKKLMIVAMVAVTAICSQAASLKWSATAVNAVDANGNLLTALPAGYDIVLAYLGTKDNYSYDNATAVNNTKSATTPGAKWTFVQDPELGNLAQGSGTTDGSTVAFAAEQAYAVMLKDADGKLSQLKYADGTLDDIVYISDYNGKATWSGNFQFASKDYVVGSIPEPTSAMLLLLGVAGLALRRRRA